MESEPDQEVKIINGSPQADDLGSEGPDEAAVEEGSASGHDHNHKDAEANIVVRPINHGVELDLPRPQGRKREPTALT